jgi:hypothetical protein
MARGINDSCFTFRSVLYRLGLGRYSAPMTQTAARHDKLAPSVSWVPQFATQFAGLFPQLFRLSHRLALAFALVLVCVGTASAGQGGTNLLGVSLDPSGFEAAVTETLASAPDSNPTFRSSNSCPDVDDLKAVEFDPDDHELLSRLPEVASLELVLHSVPHLREHAFRVERLLDTSRFAVSTGLPRGPPA